MTGNRRRIGLDVHREFAQVAVWQAGAVTQAGTFATTPEGVREFAAGLGPADEVALEATGNTWAIAAVHSYLGLNPRVRQSGGQPASHGKITKAGPAHARGMLVEAAWSASKAPGPLGAFYCRSGPAAACRSPRSRPPASSPSCAGT